MSLQHKQLGKAELMYECPLCGMSQEVWIRGLDVDTVNNCAVQTKDKKYAFCNCHNVFFTNWSNIRQDEYNDDYNKRYVNESIRHYYKCQSDVYMPQFKELAPQASTFLEIGTANDFILDEARNYGYEACGLDINPPDKTRTDIIYGNIEDRVTQAKLSNYDIIWASHVFEHFKNPLNIIDLCHSHLNDNGIMFVAMPDPYFIIWQAPQYWWHWAYKEHHIMWDMDSFIDVVLERGFRLIKSVRNDGIKFHTRGDYHLVFQKESLQ